jgi:MFS transporter, ACS family, solute carrier family 17 (sodium-dependent inorganic phosphate cotransporter), other
VVSGGGVRVSQVQSGSRWQVRYRVLAWCFTAVLVCYIDRVNISVAALAMQENYHWSNKLKGLVLSAFFLGYLLFQVPSGYLTQRFGGIRVLPLAVVFWSVFTLATPLAAASSVGALILARIAMGVGEAAMFPAAFGILADYIPTNERARSVSILMSGIPLGTLFGLGATGAIVSTHGWQLAFYSFGILGLIWSFTWCATTNFRRSTRSADVPESTTKIPWRRLLRSPAVWALLVNHFCSNWTLYMLLAWLPSYFHSHGQTIASSGFRSAAPWFTNLVTANWAAWYADRLVAQGRSVTYVRKAAQVTALVGSATFLLCARNATDDTAALLLICGALGCLGLILSGIYPNLIEIAPRHAGGLMSITNTLATLPGVIGVYVTGWIVSVTGTFAAAFVLAASLSAIAAVVWLLFASSEPVVE